MVIQYNNLTSQVNKLSKAAERGFQIISRQIQANTKMTLLNRMALDLLLAKEQGLCQYLKLDREYCCVHIPNGTENLER